MPPDDNNATANSAHLPDPVGVSTSWSGASSTTALPSNTESELEVSPAIVALTSLDLSPTN